MSKGHWSECSRTNVPPAKMSMFGTAKYVPFLARGTLKMKLKWWVLKIFFFPLDYPGGLNLLTRALKSTELSQTGIRNMQQQETSERFRAWEPLNPPLVEGTKWKGREIMGTALRSEDQSLATNQQRKWNFSATCTRNWIQPRTEVGPEAGYPPEPSWRNALP